MMLGIMTAMAADVATLGLVKLQQSSFNLEMW